jgi:hypothetical protein
MTNKGLLLAAAGVVFVVVGLFALNLPVHLADYDRYGFQVNCGTGYFPNMTQSTVADQAGHGTSYVDRCNTAVTIRRVWTIPLAALGSLIIAGLIVALWKHADSIERHTTASDHNTG